MSWADPIGDMLARIRNAYAAKQETVEFQHSRLKGELVKLLKKEGFISDYTVEGQPRKVLRVYLKYLRGREPAVRGLRRVSRPGGRVTVPVDKIPRPLGGLGIAVLSTSQGLLTDAEARQRRVGGEVLCTVW